jgi:UDP-GlcNAc:undecaprenyl-phosphate GlcNAc-1-phosphate transferase
MRLLIVGFASFLFSVLLTPLVRRMAHATGQVSAPRQDRWHSRPTALLGGVAIYLAFLVGCVLFAWQVPGAHLILMGGTLLFLAGLLDDLIGLKPYVKLVLQLVVAALVVYWGRRLPWTNIEAVNILLTIFWLVGITNAVNLLDNMDGLAGGISVIACLSLATTFLLNGQVEQALLPVLLGGAALGFLFYNFQPATIFMGDCGSMFLGFVLGATALLSEYDRTRNLGAVLVTPVLILLIPIFDTCFVTVMRKLAGRPISQGGRDHTSHRLVALGISERRAVLLLYALAASASALAVSIRAMQPFVLFWLIPLCGLGLLCIGIYLGKVRVYESGHWSGAGTRLRTFTDFTYKRRVIEILIDTTLITLAYFGAFLLRFDGGMTAEQMQYFFSSLPLVIAAQMLAFLACGIYRGLWRYADVHDFVTVGKAVFAGILAGASLVLLFKGRQTPSHAVFVLHALLLMILVCASRWSFRLLRAMIVGPTSIALNAKLALIYGAGNQGERLVNELLQRPIEHRYRPVAFLDDDPHKVGKLMHGLRIHSSQELTALLRRYQISTVLISSEKISDPKLAAFYEHGLAVARTFLRLDIKPCEAVSQSFPSLLTVAQEESLKATPANVS